MQRSEAIDAIRMSISNAEQPLPLPSEFERFWCSSDNKIQFQKFFIAWLVEYHHDQKPVYLGGCHQNAIDKCFVLQNGTLIEKPSLEYSCDEADDRIIFHLNNAVQTDGYTFAHAVFSDTDIMVNIVYHHIKWKTYGLREIWMLQSGTVTPLHEIHDSLPKEAISILPAIHALTGCDTTAKVGTKLQAFSASKKAEHFQLRDFGVNPLDQDMVSSAECFLLDCMSKIVKRTVDSFDTLRYEARQQQSTSFLVPPLL